MEPSCSWGEEVERVLRLTVALLAKRKERFLAVAVHSLLEVCRCPETITLCHEDNEAGTMCRSEKGANSHHLVVGVRYEDQYALLRSRTKCWQQSLLFSRRLLLPGHNEERRN